ncbi:MAG: ATP synthase subunit I [Candidatus Omnitrophica bacterium]|nr:ATP synthase subunit I [Candidatus Omnitrophota bacterium]
MREDLNELKARISKKAFFTAALFAVIALLLKRYYLGAGLMLGSLVSIFNFNMLAKKAEKIAQNKIMPVYFVFGYTGRYLLMALALFAAAKSDLAAFIGAAIGLFSVRFAVYCESFSKKGIQCRT